LTELLTPVNPLLKWPGGKRRLLGNLLPYLPETYGTYFEPFLGGGAVLFALQPTVAIVSDQNADLISTYEQVKKHPRAVMNQLALLKNSEEDFYQIRALNPTSEAGRAARLIYLTNLSFNGIHRVNKRGEFNVPYGHKTQRPVYDPESIKAISKVLQPVQLYNKDFAEITKLAKAGDLVYLDPPYTVAHGSNGFVKYNDKIFSWADQERLAHLAIELNSRGCHVVVSNADHDSIRHLYKTFSVVIIGRHSIMAASSRFRRPITECIFHNGKARHAE
jgi:DNA adenine methylase